ncbi:MAG: hypothetical protein ACK4GT_04035 [Pararhodobacter sp.]
MHVLIVGDSHTGALERGRALLEEQGDLPPGIEWCILPLGTGARANTAFWTLHEDHAVLVDKHYARRLSRLPPQDPRPDVIGLSMPLWSGRVVRGLLERGFVPHGLPGGGRVISRALLRRIVRADMRYTLELALFLRESGIPLLVIEPPRAFHALRFVRQNGAEAVLALQEAVRALQRAEVERAGLPVVWMPDDALGADGFMRPEHAHEDPSDTHHTNAAFGAMMLRRVVPVAQALALQLEKARP